MRIRPYISERDFDEIKNWITDERTHALWCANLIRYPLEKENFENKLAELALQYGDSPYVFTTDEGKTVGFFCYSVNCGANEGMLKFVMVSPTLRGKGYGREMVSLAVKYAFEITKADTVQLNVFSDNTAAKKCYLSAGFSERALTEKAFCFYDEMWGRCNMAIRKSEFQSIIQS